MSSDLGAVFALAGPWERPLYASRTNVVLIQVSSNGRQRAVEYRDRDGHARTGSVQFQHPRCAGDRQVAGITGSVIG
ncbi:hypothetical protein [Kibdelosporangium phytohabitans]|uniref:Uncharacterized protein n=1 Tax=Kibdelosporangium phytohabitans TaxID=860235 RepID=A0A0N9I6L9_9PSEU|nr:hypothetical protein [Kibdelosporangium phytohabitans]ALG10409.1 hypothetical protein AOZ06_29095 [Kibdelosporangium phytohabitans]MBE1461474.1 hypothetical protein [Kibdelosporangium phytohabitans]